LLIEPVLLLLWSSAAAGAVSLQATSATVGAPGETADVCVALSTGGAEVAGTQNDLNWDGTCASLADERSCFVTGSHGKQLSAATTCGDFCLRAIILSLTDVDPIPDGQLYCCQFAVEAAPGSCCPIAVVNVGASDPQGRALVTNGHTADLCVAADGAVRTPTATPAARVEVSSTNDGGCQVSAPKAHGVLGPMSLAVAIASATVRFVFAVRRRRQRRVR
jgi:hypothetical protein